ncbi:MAG: helix-turn-helix domain-containing protein [Azoarcus sp.]|nr:helix-turn-helix domain-containing protein [Azoarcus sp.]
MHAEEIKAALRMKGMTQARLADQLGVARATVSMVISGASHSARIQQAVADVLELSQNEIWPERVRIRRTQEQIDRDRAMARDVA